MSIVTSMYVCKCVCACVCTHPVRRRSVREQRVHDGDVAERARDVQRGLSARVSRVHVERGAVLPLAGRVPGGGGGGLW